MRETELSGQINLILEQGVDRRLVIAISKTDSPEYLDAIEIALHYQLIEPTKPFQYKITYEGRRAFELGGFLAWKQIHEREQKQREELSRSISVSGNAVIGNNNSGVSQGQNGTLINTGDKARINSHIETQKGDFEGLAQKLRNSHIAQQDVEELKSILESDNPNEEKRIFGDKTNGWITKMISKSLDGTWQIGVGAAGGLLVEAIKTFYGWH